MTLPLIRCGMLSFYIFTNLASNFPPSQVRLVSAVKALLVALAVFSLLSTALLAGQRWHYKRNSDLDRERLIPVDLGESQPA